MHRKFFPDILDVDAKTAQEDACRTEHVLSSKTIEKLADYIDRTLKNKERENRSE